MIKDKRYKIYAKLVLNFLVVFLYVTTAVHAEALTFTDSGGHQITIEQYPARVVSLVPGITETIFALGAGDRLVGRTYHGSWPPATAEVPVMGGFFHLFRKKSSRQNRT